MLDEALLEPQARFAPMLGRVSNQDSGLARIGVPWTIWRCLCLEGSWAERVDTIELVVGAAVPELPEVEHCIDVGRRLARLDLAIDQVVGVERIVRRVILQRAFLVENSRRLGPA